MFRILGGELTQPQLVRRRSFGLKINQSPSWFLLLSQPFLDASFIRPLSTMNQSASYTSRSSMKKRPTALQTSRGPARSFRRASSNLPPDAFAPYAAACELEHSASPALTARKQNAPRRTNPCEKPIDSPTPQLRTKEIIPRGGNPTQRGKYEPVNA